jgi:NAD(P)-dependent dehydrogenase (short-subunit alcohol dehydrogenase family)
MNYEGKTVFITGGAKGIGRGVCNVFASYGANVVVADFNIDGAEDAAKSIIANGGNAYAIKIDVANKESVVTAVDQAVKKYGSIEMMVNVAGIIVSEKLENLEENDWNKVIDVNLKGSFLVGQAVANEMKKNRYGKIVFIASAAAKDAEYGNGVYCISKAGVDMLTHIFASELAEYGINVNSVNPSYVDTDIMQHVFQERGPLEGMTPEEYKEALLSTVPMRRMASVTEIGELCAMLCSDKIGFLHGENVIISGGKVMRM